MTKRDTLEAAPSVVKDGSSVQHLVAVVEGTTIVGESPDHLRSAEKVVISDAQRRRAERDKADAHRKMLHRFVVRWFERGRVEGLVHGDVALLHDALLILGWIPSELKVEKDTG